MSNLREYQIRITDDFGEEEVFNFHDIDEAGKKYGEIQQTRITEDTDNCYEMELIEVLDQATIQPMNNSDGL